MSRSITRGLALAGIGAAVVLTPIACSAQSSSGSSTPTATETGPGTSGGTRAELSGEGTLTAPDQTSNAYTYDPAMAPLGAVLRITLAASGESTEATLAVSGLLPNRGYAVHLHNNSCGPTGDAAGPHFQYQVDPAATPEKPSTDPEFANPRNEVWLDVRTDAIGSGMSSTEVPFVLTDRVPASVVVHEQMVTSTEPGQAGKAGNRLACLTLPNK